MRKIHAIALILGISLTPNASAQENPSPRTHRIGPLPRDLEVQLALSSLPPHLRNNATVYVLNPDQGFEVARHGMNGFHALVARTGDDAMRGSWPLAEYPDDILYPVSFESLIIAVVSPLAVWVLSHVVEALRRAPKAPDAMRWDPDLTWR